MRRRVGCGRCPRARQVVRQAVRRAGGERHDGQGRILLDGRREAAGVHHGHVVDLVESIPAVQHANSGVACIRAPPP